MAKPDLARAKLPTELGGRISVLRKKRGWSQVMFAEVVGFHRSFVADVERGKRNISILNLQAMAEALGTSLSRLLSRM